MGFADEVSKLEDVKDGDTIKAEHKNELNRALRELAKAIDTERDSLKVKDSLEVNRALKLGWDLLMARKVDGDENFKRALVVLNNPDRLFINFGEGHGDFEGGVEIMGSQILIGDYDWSRIKIEQPKWDRWDIFTEEGGENAPKHIHISTTERSILEFNNSDIWVLDGGLRIEKDILVCGDIIQRERVCPVCNKAIEDNEAVVLVLKKYTTKEGRTYCKLQPAHLACVLMPSVTDDVSERIIDKLVLRSYYSKRRLHPIEIIRHTAFGRPGVTIRYGFIDDWSMKNNTEMLVKIEKYENYFVTIYVCDWWGAEVLWNGRKICEIVPQEGRATPVALVLNNNLDLIEVVTADGKKLNY